MAFNHSRSVTTDRIRRLSVQNNHITEDIASLEHKIHGLRRILQSIHENLSIYKGLRKEFDVLANEYRASGQDATVVEHGPSGIQMSWDYEGVTRKQSYSELENEAEALDGFISKLEAELTIKKDELEQIQEQLHIHEENEQRNNDDDREPRDTDFENMDPLQNKKHVTSEDQPESVNKTLELECLGNLQSARIEELLEKNHQLENNMSTLKKQKEDLLKVNHQWDEQYRLLKDDKERVISDLHNQLQRNVVTEVNVQGHAADYSVLQPHIMELTKKNEELAEEVARLLEKQVKTDKLWLSAKKMITEEREARNAAAEQTKVVQARYTELEHELIHEKEAQVCLKQEIERLVSGDDRSSVSVSSLSPNVKEQIEMLKQQIRVYADDFANERSDRERIQTDREALKEKSKSCENEIELLKEQVRCYQDDFNKERYEKERLQRLVRNNGRTVNFIQNEDPWIVVPPNDYNPVQRRQPLVYEREEKSERNYRGKTTFSPREIQEYAYQQQLHARGPGHPGTLCHGCEADGHDVVDAAGVVKCPRCDREFSVKEMRAFDEHIDKCTI